MSLPATATAVVVDAMEGYRHWPGSRPLHRLALKKTDSQPLWMVSGDFALGACMGYQRVLVLSAAGGH